MTKYLAFDLNKDELNAVLFTVEKNGKNISPKKIEVFKAPVEGENALKKMVDWAKKENVDILLSYHYHIMAVNLMCVIFSEENAGQHYDIIDDEHHHFLLLDVLKMAHSYNLPKGHSKLSLAAKYFGAKRCKNGSETIMNVFCKIWEKGRHFTFAPYYGWMNGERQFR